MAIPSLYILTPSGSPEQASVSRSLSIYKEKLVCSFFGNAAKRIALAVREFGLAHRTETQEMARFMLAEFGVKE